MIMDTSDDCKKSNAANSISQNYTIPREYMENLKKRVITYEMLDDALYAVNKRAKNWRDVKRERKRSMWADAELFGVEAGESVEEAEKIEQEMYEKKMELLAVIPPVCIHKEIVGYKKKYVCDTCIGYDDLYLHALFHNAICEKGSFWIDGFHHDYFLMKDVPRYQYYTVRFMGNHTFHTPIPEEDLGKYDLPILLTGYIKTEGVAERYLASMAYVDEILKLVRSGNFIYDDRGRDIVLRKPLPIELQEYKMLSRREWEEVRGILQKYYPENKSLLKKLPLDEQLWKNIMSRTISVKSCMDAILVRLRKKHS